VREFSLTGFAGLLTTMSVSMHVAHHVALEHAALIVETEAKRVLGTYDYDWPQLAESTQDERGYLGFPDNEPLLRTGELRDSIEHTVETKAAHVGSNNDKAVWQELGTTTIPARSFLAGAAAHKFNEVGHEIGRVVHGYLSNGGVVVQDRIGLTGSH
jgi:hypothetical protein